jgi:cell division protein FtsB
MQTKIHYLKAIVSDFIARMHDIRFAGQVVFVLIVLIVSWSGVRAIQMNYNLQKQITTTKQENIIQKLQNNNLTLQNEYYSSKQYLGLQARLNFGLALPGEQEILVPRSVALAYAPKITVNDNEPSKISVPSLQRHITDWVNFFLHRQ